MPYITSQNAAITAERNWLISKQYQGQWSPAERARLKDIAKRYKVKWSGNTRKIPWNTLLERVDIIPTSMVATMAAAESGWGTSKLARNNNNLFGMKCMKGRCTNAPGKVKGYSQFSSVKESVSAYVTNLNFINHHDAMFICPVEHLFSVRVMRGTVGVGPNPVH